MKDNINAPLVIAFVLSTIFMIKLCQWVMPSDHYMMTVEPSGHIEKVRVCMDDDIILISVDTGAMNFYRIEHPVEDDIFKDEHDVIWRLFKYTDSFILDDYEGDQQLVLDKI